MLVAKSGSASERGEGRMAGGSKQLAVEPSYQALEIDSHGGGDRLEMGFRQAMVTGVTQVQSVSGLRHGALNPRALGIEFFEGVGGLSLAGSLQRQKEFFGHQGEQARAPFAPST